jgi:hypothetical protein
MTRQGLVIPFSPDARARRNNAKLRRVAREAATRLETEGPSANRAEMKKVAEAPLPTIELNVDPAKLERLLGRGKPRQDWHRPPRPQRGVGPSHEFLQHAARVLSLDDSNQVTGGASEARAILRRGPAIIVMRGARKRKGGKSRPRPDGNSHEKSLALVVRPAGVGIHVGGEELVGRMAIVAPLTFTLREDDGDGDEDFDDELEFWDSSVDDQIVEELMRAFAAVLSDASADIHDLSSVAMLLNTSVYFEVPGTAKVVEVAEDEDFDAPADFDIYGRKRTVVAVIGTRRGGALDEKRAKWIADKLEARMQEARRLTEEALIEGREDALILESKLTDS